MGYLYKPSRVSPGSCRHPAPHIFIPLSSLNGWDSRGLYSSAQAKRLETTCEYIRQPGVWREALTNARLLRRSSSLRTFLLLLCFFAGGRDCAQSLQRIGKLRKRRSGTSHATVLTMDCVYLFMCFSFTHVFVEHIFAAEAHGELSLSFSCFA